MNDTTLEISDDDSTKSYPENENLAGVSEPTAEEPVYPQEPQIIRPNRHERRKAAALARKARRGAK